MKARSFCHRTALTMLICVYGAFAQISATKAARKGPPGASTKQELPLSDLFQNDRLKLLRLDPFPITGGSTLRIVDGVWESESKAAGKQLTFPQQVKIICHSYDKTCQVLHVSIAPSRIGVSINDIDEEDFDISSWDESGLFAASAPGPKDCQRSVLSMSFRSGAVSLSDIPTHDKGCEMFTETNSYRLVRGNYYVDTTPGNDSDKPVKK